MNDTKRHNNLEPHTPILDSITSNSERTKNDGFALPDGYFTDLQHDIITKATLLQGEKADNSWKSAILRTAGLASGFAAMVTLAVTLVKLTPNDAISEHQSNQIYAQIEEMELLQSMTSDDVLEVIWSQEDEDADQSELVAQIDDYMDLMGVNLYAEENIILDSK